MFTWIKQTILRRLLRNNNYVITNNRECEGAFVGRSVPKKTPTAFTFMLLSVIAEDMRDLKEYGYVTAAQVEDVVKAMRKVATDIKKSAL